MRGASINGDDMMGKTDLGETDDTTRYKIQNMDITENEHLNKNKTKVKETQTRTRLD